MPNREPTADASVPEEVEIPARFNIGPKELETMEPPEMVEFADFFREASRGDTGAFKALFERIDLTFEQFSKLFLPLEHLRAAAEALEKIDAGTAGTNPLTGLTIEAKEIVTKCLKRRAANIVGSNASNKLALIERIQNESWGEEYRVRQLLIPTGLTFAEFSALKDQAGNLKKEIKRRQIHDEHIVTMPTVIQPPDIVSPVVEPVNPAPEPATPITPPDPVEETQHLSPVDSLLVLRRNVLDGLTNPPDSPEAMQSWRNSLLKLTQM
jgi:hypothetical protein